VLVPIWWMYGGYVWLTNDVRANWQMRLVPIAAMAGFLAIGSVGSSVLLDASKG
jgi:hypothetical protein